MKTCVIITIFFILITGFRTQNTDSNGPNSPNKPFCGILSYFVENNTSSGCTVGTLYVTYPGIPSVFPVNYSSGQSGNVGLINAPGTSTSTLYSMRISVTGYCDVVRLYRAGVLLQTIWGAPNNGFYYFYNVPGGCTSYTIVVE